MGHEEHDEYLRVVSKTFRSEEKGYQFYNEYAKIKEFSIRKEEVKYLPGTRTRFRRLYTCFKEGHRTLANFERPNPKRTPKALTRCGCKAHLEIELIPATDEWFVKDFEDKHNHELAKEGDAAYLYSHRRMADGQKADVVGYGIGGLRTHQIMNVMEHSAGGLDKTSQNQLEKKQHPGSSGKEGVKPEKSGNKKVAKPEKSDKKKPENPGSSGTCMLRIAIYNTSYISCIFPEKYLSGMSVHVIRLDQTQFLYAKSASQSEPEPDRQ